MAGLDQARRGHAGNQERGVVAVIDLPLVALRQAVADPEHAGRYLTGHLVGSAHSSALLVAIDVARHRYAPVTGFKNLVQHLIVPRHDLVAMQDATIAGRDGLDV